MGKKANPTIIGAFVVSSITIAVIAVMVFGGAKFFAQNDMFVSYFSDTIHGLDIGAPVKYKGVTIGKVEDIRLRIRDNNLRDSTVSVIYSVDIRALRRKSGTTSETLVDTMDHQIKEGLRAKLSFQSIVTGMLYIELDYLASPDEPYTEHHSRMGYKEIPIARSMLSEMGKSIDKMMANISKIDFEEISGNANKLLLNLNSKIDQLDVKKINDDALEALANVNKVIQNPAIGNSLANVDELLKEVRSLVAKLDGTLENIEKSANIVMKDADEMLLNVNSIIAPQSPFRFELAMALKQLSDTLSSVKNLAEFVERNPNSIITGKAAAGDAEKK